MGWFMVKFPEFAQNPLPRIVQILTLSDQQVYIPLFDKPQKTIPSLMKGWRILKLCVKAVSLNGSETAFL
jgi:hypothetical protein